MRLALWTLAAALAGFGVAWTLCAWGARRADRAYRCWVCGQVHDEWAFLAEMGVC